MTDAPAPLNLLPCLDSAARAARCEAELAIPRHRAAELGRSAVEVIESGHYHTEDGRLIDLQPQVRAALEGRRSIPPWEALPAGSSAATGTSVQVVNDTTLRAARALTDAGHRPLALNFANGIHPGGGFLNGARAQEEVLCRSSALYATLEGDAMYEHHRKRPRPDSTDWAIHSPDVPVFRSDAGAPLDEPWLLSFLTCAAPYAPAIGQPESGDLLAQRILRVLKIARALDYRALVLGAWGCGAFRNDPRRTAQDFRRALEGEFRGAFSTVVFAVTDWSPERRHLGPFRDCFA